MSSDLAISVRGVSKAYTIRRWHEEQITLAEQVLSYARHPFSRPNKEIYWALDDVSFDVRKGEVLGIIGRNGAGKSTLLKVLSRITAPTKGEVRLYGRVGSLLEVGTGFHPELTGRENIYLNGSILGMHRREIDRQFDAIVDFACVEQFLDTPVKRYSTGMYVRLAFAVAAHLESEILLVDEVLAVGDAEFQKKCLGKIGEVTDGGRTAILVSHNLGAIASTCQTAVLLERGQLQAVGSVDETLDAYERMHGLPTGAVVDLRELVHVGDPIATRLVHLRMLRFAAGSAVQTEGEPLKLELELECAIPQLLSFGLGLFAPDGTPVVLGFTEEIPLKQGTTLVRATMHDLDLVRAEYRISVSVGTGSDRSGILHEIDGVENAGTLHVVPGDQGTQQWLRHWGWRRHRALEVKADLR